MEDNQYIEKLEQIRKLIYSLVDELYELEDNRKLFDYDKSKLQVQVIDDILHGYEKEYE